MGHTADLRSLPLPEVSDVLGRHIEVETKESTKYVRGYLASASLHGFAVALDNGALVEFAWEGVTAALVSLGD